MDDLNVIDRFTETFVAYIESGFGLLGPDVAFLGPAPMNEIAEQINLWACPSGANRDYVLELARALRSMGYSDPHVFEVEQAVLQAGQ